MCILPQNRLVIDYTGQPIQNINLTDPAQLTKMGCYARIRSDIDKIKDIVAIEKPSNSSQMVAKLNSLRSELEKQEFPEDFNSFRAIVPYNDLHRKVFGVYSQILNKQGFPAISLWHSSPYKLLPLFTKPDGQCTDLKISMLQNERRAEVFNITNVSPNDKDFSFNIEGLPGGINPDYIKIYQVEYVDTRSGVVLSTALTPLKQNNGVFRSNVASGMTRQIWISVDRPEIKGGDYNGKIMLTCGLDKKQIDFELSIASIRMPDKLDCSLGMFDYINTKTLAITQENQLAAINDMKDHLVDIVFGFRENIYFRSVFARILQN